MKGSSVNTNSDLSCDFISSEQTQENRKNYYL